MNQNKRKKTLHVLSCFETLLGLLSSAFGLFMIHGGTTMIDAEVRSLNSQIDNTPIFIAIGVILIFEGIFALTGSSFARSMVKDLSQYKPALYFTMITFMFNGINLVFALVSYVKIYDIIVTIFFMLMSGYMVQLIWALKD